MRSPRTTSGELLRVGRVNSHRITRSPQCAAGTSSTLLSGARHGPKSHSIVGLICTLQTPSDELGSNRLVAPLRHDPRGYRTSAKTASAVFSGDWPAEFTVCHPLRSSRAIELSARSTTPIRKSSNGPLRAAIRRRTCGGARSPCSTGSWSGRHVRVVGFGGRRPLLVDELPTVRGEQVPG